MSAEASDAAGGPVRAHGRAPAAAPAAAPSWQDLQDLARRILQYANVRVPRDVFLRKLSRLVLAATGCEELSLMRTKDGASRYVCEAQLGAANRLRYRSRVFESGAPDAWPGSGEEPLDRLRRRVLAGDGPLPDLAGIPGRLTPHGSWWSDPAPGPGVAARGLAVIRFAIEEGNLGLLELRGPARPLDAGRVEFFECVAQFIGIAIADRRAREAVCRRVNELTCLNDLTEIFGSISRPLPSLLDEAVELLPGGFPFPGRVRARIVLDGAVHTAPGFRRAEPSLSVPLAIGGRERGRIELRCVDEQGEPMPPSALAAERLVLESLARQIGLLLERRQVREERARLEEQLRHADRLATIGQLAAGVAHELNEPLTNVLGFAELVGEDDSLSEQAQRDVRKIVDAAIHGREIVKKLLIFSRQLPSRRSAVDLNAVIRETIAVLKGRFSRLGISIRMNLAEDLPPLTADPGQLQQVLVNLAVNALQAMPEGGWLRLGTSARDGWVAIEVEDTGCGMSEEVRSRAFLPFFTTKDVGQGTGLGLAVVHGIVSDHGGRIEVRSEPGKGSRFTVLLPLAASAGEPAAVGAKADGTATAEAASPRPAGRAGS